MSFNEARDAFIKQGLKIRTQGEVCKPQDLIGGIMTLDPFRSWIYVTNIEFRYDAKASMLAMARLEGYLPDRTFIREDSTTKLPSSFRILTTLEGIGPVHISLGGQLHKVESIRYSVSKFGAILLIQECSECLPIEGGGGGENAQCQMVAGGNCNGIFCTKACKAVAGDPCDCSGFGFCYSIPGGSCQGTCPDGQRCAMVAPNPGQFFCACINN
jgi:hypothetical protein